VTRLYARLARVWSLTGGRDFSLSRTTILTVESLFNVYGWGGLAPGVKQLGCVTDRIPPSVSRTKVQNKWSYTFTAPVRIIRGVFRNYFAFTQHPLWTNTDKKYETIKLSVIIIKVMILVILWLHRVLCCVNLLCCSCLLNCSLNLQKSEICTSRFWSGCTITILRPSLVKSCCVRTTEHMKL
jgi:hypothetical protein